MGNRDSLPVTDVPKGGVNSQSVDYHRRDDSLSGSLNTMTSQGSTMKMDDSASPSTPSAESTPIRGEEKGGCIKRGDGLKIIIVSTIIFAIAITVALIIQIYTGPPQVPPHGGVSSSVSECSTIGVDILKAKGNAVDAAIATMFCVGLFNSHKSGLGGGGFMLIHNRKTDKSEVFDFREVSPLAIKKDADYNTFLDGVLSVAVPGEVSGMHMAYEHFGSKSLSWKDLIAPSIKLAKEGFLVNEGLAKALAKLQLSEVKKNFLDIFSHQNKWLTVNETIKRPDLAKTFEALQENPVDNFYRGAISQDILKTVGASAGGIMSADDLRLYNATTRAPIKTMFKDYKVLTVPAPASGPILLLILNILENFVNGTSINPFIGNNSAEWYHYMVEAMKFAYGQKIQLGDPDKAYIVTSTMETMINKTFAMNIYEQIDPMKPLASSQYSQYHVTMGHGTEHISVVDTDDLYVSVSTSLNTGFGSKLMTEGGIILNNHMIDFSDPKSASSSPNNLIEGGKRPLSSMAPTVFYHSKRICGKRVAIGGMNGTRIPSGIAQLILNLSLTKDADTHINDLVNMFRIHSMASTTPVVEIEDINENSRRIASELENMGHTVQRVPRGGINSVNLVMKINEVISAIGDTRSGDTGSRY